jgi:UDP-glucose 4-epimerase
VRGNQSFAYSWHKRLVEEMLAAGAPSSRNWSRSCSASAPSSARRCNQITDLFEKPRLIAIRGSDSPFVFIWDQDVVGAMCKASIRR